MPLQKFRDKQKIIYWVVALIVIPTFILLGYAQILMGKPGDQVVGKIGGKDCVFSEYSQYRQRLFAVNMGREVFYTNGDYKRLMPEAMATFYSMALTEHAKEFGIVISDEEIGTFIRAQFGYQGKDPKKLQKMVERAIGTVIRLDSVYEYKKAVREWLLLKKFLQVLDNTCLVPQALGDLKYAHEKAEYTVRSLFIPSDKFVQAAKKEFEAMPEADVLARAEAFIKANQIEKNRYAMPFLWSSAKWRLEYITVPMVVPGLEQKADDKKLKDFYETNQYRYKNKDGKSKSYAEVRDQVALDYRRSVRMKTAMQTLGSDFSRFMNRLAMSDKFDHEKGVSLGQINADPRLVSRGLRAGSTGTEEKSVKDLMDDPAFKGSTLAFMLSNLERKLRAAKNNDEVLRVLGGYKRFRGMSYNGRGGEERPIQSGDAMFKIRIISYTPGKKLSLKGADGKIDQLLLKDVKEELVNELAMTKAQEQARKAMAKMKDKEVGGIKVEEKKKTFYTLQGVEHQLTSIAVGQTLDPIAKQRPAGYEVMMLAKRHIPVVTPAEAKKATSALTDGWRGNSIYAPEYTLNPVIKIGNRLRVFMSVQYNNGEFQVYNNLMQQ